MNWKRDFLDERTRSIRTVEEAALAIILERLPMSTTEPELVDCMTIECQVPATSARLRSISAAVAGLVGAGLLMRDGVPGSILEPTAAASRAAELDIGL